MSETKIIGFFGTNQTDVCIYVGAILQNLDYRVCVVDNSYEQAMQFCIPKPLERIPTITYKNIDYERLVSYEQWTEKEYDFLLVDLGVWPQDEALKQCREVYLITDCAIAQVKRYRELMCRVKIPMNVIVRDVCADAVSAKKIINLLQEENCFIMEWYGLPWHEEDATNRLLMQYYGFQNFNRLSHAFEKILIRICHSIAECESTVIWKSYRRAKKGECA